MKLETSYILPKDLNILFHSKQRWKFKDLKTQLGINDSKLLKMMLYAAGFTDKGNGFFEYNELLDKTNTEYFKQHEFNQHTCWNSKKQL